MTNTPFRGDIEFIPYLPNTGWFLYKQQTFPSCKNRVVETKWNAVYEILQEYLQRSNSSYVLWFLCFLAIFNMRFKIRIARVLVDELPWRKPKQILIIYFLYVKCWTVKCRARTLKSSTISFSNSQVWKKIYCQEKFLYLNIEITHWLTFYKLTFFK